MILRALRQKIPSTFRLFSASTNSDSTRTQARKNSAMTVDQNKIQGYSFADKNEAEATS